MKKKGFILITLLIFTSVLGVMYLSHLVWLGGVGRQVDYFILESQAQVLAEAALEFKNAIPLEKSYQQESLIQTSSNYIDNQSLREIIKHLTQIATFKWNKDF
jgi:hypothetical protein